MTVLMPVPGDPGTVREVATALLALGRRTAGVAGVLVTLREGSAWQTPAGAAFHARVAETPPVLDAVADRYAGAAVVLRRFADALETAQGGTGRASAAREEAFAQVLRIEDALAGLRSTGTAWDAPGTVALLTEQRRQVGLQVAAERAHARAWAEYQDADRACAASLRALTRDTLGDSATYRLLTGASEVTHDAATGLGLLALAAPPLAPVAGAASAAGAALDATVLVAYGDGEWGSVAADATVGALGAAGKVLKAGALVGAADSGGAAEGLSSAARLAAGARTVAQSGAADLVAAFRVVEPEAAGTAAAAGAGGARGTGRGLAGLRSAAARARERALRAARSRADEAFLDDWTAMVAGGAGAEAPGLYAGGSAMSLTAGVVTRARTAAHVERQVHDGVAGGAPPPGPGAWGAGRSVVPSSW